MYNYIRLMENAMDKKFMKSLLLGLGFDCKDGHLRITHGKNFRLYGGSESTHNLMVEKAIKFNKQLNKNGKDLEQISEKEFHNIADKIGLKITDPNRN